MIGKIWVVPVMVITNPSRNVLTHYPKNLQKYPTFSKKVDKLLFGGRNVECH